MLRQKEVITVVGTGFVGLTTALVYVAHGYKVYGLDIDARKIDLLKNCEPPFYEPGLKEELDKQTKTGRLKFTTSYKDSIQKSSIIIICVGTPSDKDGDVDMSFIESTLKSIAQNMNDDTIIVIKSTVPLGSIKLARKIVKKYSDKKCSFASMPEFLREGFALEDSFNPSMILIGAREKGSADRLIDLNSFFGQDKILTVSPESAQLIKYANNAHGAMRIVFINDIATLCDHYGANIDDVLRGLPFSKTVNDYPFYPGLGYGGSCFPKDVKALSKLSQKLNCDDLFTALDKLNEKRPRYVIDILDKEIGGGIGGKRIAILGLSFKPNTDDQRYSPALCVIPYLLKNNCKVVSYDPLVERIADDNIANNPFYCQAKTIDEAIKDADIIMPLIEWPEIIDYDFYNLSLPQSKNVCFADMRNQFNAVELHRAGYNYFGIGRPNHLTITGGQKRRIMNIKNREIKRQNRLLFFVVSAIIYAAIIICFVNFYELSTGLKHSFSALLVLFMIYIFSKYLFASFYQSIDSNYNKDDLKKATVTLIVPMFNERADLLKNQVKSIKKQKKQFKKVYYIDDGSESIREGVEYIRKVAKKHKFINLVELKNNVGKRAAQCEVIPKVSTDFIMTTDSDSMLDKDCLYNLLIPFFSNKKRSKPVAAVTGKVLAYNHSSNLLTKILNMRYFNAFDNERASQSVTGSVLVASGPSTVYRTELIKDNIDQYKNQRFLGKIQTYGDDRCLTNIALKHGLVLYQSNALVLTEIPSTIRQFRKQQIRWSRSFFRESILGIKSAAKNGRLVAVAWIAMELIMFIAILLSLAINIYFMIIPGQLWLELLAFFGFICINALIRNVYYSSVSVIDYIKAPIYGALHMFLVIPVKIFALLTLSRTSWETRKNN